MDDQCEACNGSGVQTKVRPECCGNLTRGGDCRADCAVPVEYEDACEQCGDQSATRHEA